MPRTIEQRPPKPQMTECWSNTICAFVERFDHHCGDDLVFDCGEVTKRWNTNINYVGDSVLRTLCHCAVRAYKRIPWKISCSEDMKLLQLTECQNFLVRNDVVVISPSWNKQKTREHRNGEWPARRSLILNSISGCQCSELGGCDSGFIGV